MSAWKRFYVREAGNVGDNIQNITLSVNATFYESFPDELYYCIQEGSTIFRAIKKSHKARDGI